MQQDGQLFSMISKYKSSYLFDCVLGMIAILLVFSADIYLLSCNVQVESHTGFLWNNFLQLFYWDTLNGSLFGKRGRELCILEVPFGITRAQVLELGLRC